MPSAHPIDSPAFKRLGHTLPGRVVLFGHQWPEHPALREKWRGIWRQYSWHDYLQNCLCFAEALRSLGGDPKGRVAIISDNRPEWLFADIGTQFMGAVSAGVYTTNPAADVAYVLNHCRASVVICEDQEQVDKVLDSPEPLLHLQLIVVIEPAGTGNYTDKRLCSWEAFMDRGRVAAAALKREAVESMVEALDPDRPAVLVYTSGTTGPPKGALLTPRAMLSLSSTYMDELQGSADDSLLSYLPLCHVAEKIFSQFTPLTSGACVHFGESIDTIRQDLGEVSPTIFLGVPRIWEKISAGVEVGMRNSSPLKRRLYRWSLVRGRRLFEARQSGRAGAGTRLAYLLADWLVLRALRERLGLGRCRLAVSGAAPIAPDLLAWFHWIGVPILEGWGLSESCGISHLNLPSAFRLGSVGRAATGVECRLQEDGEVLIRGPHLFSGYLDNEAATAEALTKDGWLRTGDLGEEDADGYLYIVGRKKEILITAGGKNLSPNKIENALKTSPYIKEVAAVADARAFVSALIQIEPELCGDWASRNGVNYTSFEDLSARPEIIKLIHAEVQTANQRLARVEQVREFRLLPKELHEDDGEVTATQKLKRRVVYQRFASLIEEIYDRPQAS